MKTPRTAKSLRHFKQEFHRNPSKLIIRKLFKSAEQLAAEREIANFRAAGLREALDIKKKKRQKNKKLNLLGEMLNSSAQWQLRSEIQVALVYQYNKEANTQREKDKKKAKKKQAEIDRKVKKAFATKEKKAKKAKKAK